jgi:uncharacterized repeat protein (TIGR02543 family)
MKKLFILPLLIIALLSGCEVIEDTQKNTTYTIKFNANGGKGIMPEQLFTSNTPQPLNTNTFKRDGYIFTEWNTTVAGDGVTYMSGNYYSLTNDITLYAQWKKENEPTVIKKYTDKFNPNGGNGKMTDMSFNYDDEKTLNANTFTRDDYTFSGWAISADGDVVYTNKQKVKNLTTENDAIVTLYAVWTSKYTEGATSWADYSKKFKEADNKGKYEIFAEYETFRKLHKDQAAWEKAVEDYEDAAAAYEADKADVAKEKAMKDARKAVLYTVEDLKALWDKEYDVRWDWNSKM